MKIEDLKVKRVIVTGLISGLIFGSIQFLAYLITDNVSNIISSPFLYLGGLLLLMLTIAIEYLVLKPSSNLVYYILLVVSIIFFSIIISIIAFGLFLFLFMDSISLL